MRNEISTERRVAVGFAPGAKYQVDRSDEEEAVWKSGVSVYAYDGKRKDEVQKSERESARNDQILT